MPKPPMPTLRLLVNFALALVAFSLVFTLNGYLRTPEATLPERAWLLPAILVIALPLATGWALLMAWGSREPARRPRLRTGVLFATLAACASLGVFVMVVPSANARVVALRAEHWNPSPTFDAHANPRCQTWSELQRKAAAAGPAGSNVTQKIARMARFEMAKRAAIPAATLALAFVAFVLSTLRWRWGAWAATGAIVMIAAGWNAVYDVVQARAYAGTLAPGIAAWAPNLAIILLTVLVVVVMRRVWPVRVVATAS